MSNWFKRLLSKSGKSAEAANPGSAPNLAQKQLPVQTASFPSSSSSQAQNVPKRLPTEGYNKDLPICSVTLTIVGNTSYDHLFREVLQRPPNNNVALSLWQLEYSQLPLLLRILNGEAVSNNECGDDNLLKVLKEVCADVHQVDPSAVLINFECCSACSQSGFSIPSKDVYSFIHYFLQRGSVLQFGDFSSRALISTWESSVLGPNPFKLIGNFSQCFELRFDPFTLMNGPSAQLKIVGELCRENGFAKVHAMSGTIQFTVQNTKAEGYELKVLTVMTSADDTPVDGQESVTVNGKTYRGGVGHVWLKYPVNGPIPTRASSSSTSSTASVSASTSSSCPGASAPIQRYGQLILSAGHWIELSFLDTNFAAVKQQMAKRWGAAEAENFANAYKEMNEPQQRAWVQSNASRVMKSAGLF